MKARLFSLTMCRIEDDARFLDADSGVKGSGRSMNSKLGRFSFGIPNPLRHARGRPWRGPEVTGSPPSPFTNALRKSVVRVPDAKNLSVIFLMSVRRSPSLHGKNLA